MVDRAPLAATTRQRLRTPRAAAVAGIIFGVLLIIAFVLIRLATDHAESSATWVTEEPDRTMLLVALNLLPFAGIAFLWFIGVVRDRIGEREDRLFATVFLGSGLLFVAMLFVGGAVGGGLVLSATDTTAAEFADTWSFGRRVTLTLLSVYAMRMAAVFTLSTTTLAMRLGFVPRWLVYFGGVVALLLLLASGSVPWLELAFPLWALVLSTYLLFATLRTEPAA